jgi:hypothetical protein
MPQVSDFSPKQLALLWIQLQAGLSEPLEQFLQVEQMLLEGQDKADAKIEARPDQFKQEIKTR